MQTKDGSLDGDRTIFCLYATGENQSHGARERIGARQSSCANQERGKESVFTQQSVHTLTPYCDKPEQFQHNGIYNLVSTVVCNTD